MILRTGITLLSPPPLFRHWVYGCGPAEVCRSGKWANTTTTTTTTHRTSKHYNKVGRCNKLPLSGRFWIGQTLLYQLHLNTATEQHSSVQPLATVSTTSAILKIPH